VGAIDDREPRCTGWGHRDSAPPDVEYGSTRRLASKAVRGFGWDSRGDDERDSLEKYAIRGGTHVAECVVMPRVLRIELVPFLALLGACAAPSGGASGAKAVDEESPVTCRGECRWLGDGEPSTYCGREGFPSAPETAATEEDARDALLARCAEQGEGCEGRVFSCAPASEPLVVDCAPSWTCFARCSGEAVAGWPCAFDRGTGAACVDAAPGTSPLDADADARSSAELAALEQCAQYGCAHAEIHDCSRSEY
jgi:hypothetical protein